MQAGLSSQCFVNAVLSATLRHSGDANETTAWRATLASHAENHPSSLSPWFKEDAFAFLVEVRAFAHLCSSSAPLRPFTHAASEHRIRYLVPASCISQSPAAPARLAYDTQYKTCMGFGTGSLLCTSAFFVFLHPLLPAGDAIDAAACITKI